MKEPVFTGAATAVVTPFRNGEIDFPAFEHILEQQLEAGIRAIVVCGTTGEASTLTPEERTLLISNAVVCCAGRCKVIAGIGTNNTAQSVRYAKQAEKAGADALLAVTPYYNKASQEGLAVHYFTIVNATSLPLIAYNVPSRTGVNLTAETCARLSRHPRINGVKEASGNLSQVAHIRALCGEDFYIWSGNDDQITATMSLGGKGLISVLSNVRPRTAVRIAECCLNGDFAESSRLQCACLPLVDALFSDVNPIPVKAALEELGLCAQELRLPLTPLSEEKRTILRAALHRCPE